MLSLYSSYLRYYRHRRRRYCDHFVIMYVCGCVGVHFSTIKRKPLNTMTVFVSSSDIFMHRLSVSEGRLGTVVVLDTGSKSIDFGFKRSRVRVRESVPIYISRECTFLLVMYVRLLATQTRVLIRLCRYSDCYPNVWHYLSHVPIIPVQFGQIQFWFRILWECLDNARARDTGFHCVFVIVRPNFVLIFCCCVEQ